MRSSVPTITALIVLFTVSLVSACIFQQPVSQVSPQNETVGINVGLSPVPQAEQLRQPISFSEAIQHLQAYNATPNGSGATTKMLYYLQGRDLDSSGNAVSWFFGISDATGSKMLVFDPNGQSIIPWKVTTSFSPISTDSIVLPGILLARNNASIYGISGSGSPEHIDLELTQGTYRLTVSSGGKTRILLFNATTGVPIP